MTITQAIITLIGGVLGSGALFTFIQFMITRKDNKSDNLKRIEEKLDAQSAQITKLEQSDVNQRREMVRIQLVQLLSDFPDHAAEIFELSRVYFCELDGNSFVHKLFDEWLVKEELKQPIWYKPTK